METSQIMVHMKEEAVRKHLDDVRVVVKDWIGQLAAPSPFGYVPEDRTWGWSRAYLPDSEKDPDSNNMLRRHLNSRALWKHHADWLRSLDGAFEACQSIKARAAKISPELVLENRQVQDPAADYLGSALNSAFYRARGIKVPLEYKPGDAGGVMFGAFVIDTSATGQPEVVVKRHKALINSLAVLPATKPQGDPGMKDLADLWRRVEEHEANMQALASKSLKASDILRPCRMCKHLWK